MYKIVVNSNSRIDLLANRLLGFFYFAWMVQCMIDMITVEVWQVKTAIHHAGASSLIAAVMVVMVALAPSVTATDFRVGGAAFGWSAASLLGSHFTPNFFQNWANTNGPFYTSDTLGMYTHLKVSAFRALPDLIDLLLVQFSLSTRKTVCCG